MMRHRTVLIDKIAAGLTAVALVSMSSEAHATLSTVSNNLHTSIKNTPRVIEGMCYLSALILGGAGILGIQKHVEQPSNHPLKNAIAKLSTAGLLLAGPYTITAVRDSMSGGAPGITAQSNLTAIGSGGEPNY